MATNQAKGIIVAAIGGFLLSLDVPLIRLALSDPWTVMVVRGSGIAFALAMIYRFASQYNNTPKAPLSDPDWMLVAILHGVANVTFTISVFTTTTANLVFILAFNPMIAALLGWWLIGERPTLITWLAIAATIGGVSLIVGEGLDRGNTIGDLAALISAMILAFTLVWTRKSRKDMALAPGFGGLFSAVFAVPLAIYYFQMPGQIGWLLADALLLMPVAAFCLAWAPSFIPAPQVGMFFLIETVLAPLWVWWLFAEVPGDKTLIGGAIVLSAIAIHSVVKLQKRNA